MLGILRVRINFGSQKVNSAFFLFALCEKILPFYLSDDSSTQVATSWPSLGGGSTTPGSPLDTGRGFYEFYIRAIFLTHITYLLLRDGCGNFLYIDSRNLQMDFSGP